MKHLLAVSVPAVLALVVIVSVACEGPGPTPPPAPELTMPPATQALPPMPSPTPTVAPTPPQAPSAERAPTPEPAREPGPTSTRVPPPTPEPTPAGERIDWSPCESDPELECGFVEVPADYRDPEAGSLSIAVNVHRAASPDQRVGYLLVNPGGPGWSGLEMAAGAAIGGFSAEIVERFDIVGFDPRGVGASEPAFACGDLGEQLALLSAIDGDIDTPEEMVIGEAAANLCLQSMGSVGGRLHTEYVARDMDAIRQALGAEQISYYGAGYGAALGGWYSTLFPESVRAMVVDGADNPVDPAATQQERIAEQLEEISGFAAALAEALTACIDPECPSYNDGDPVGYFRQAAAKLDLVNAAADNPQAGLLGVITTLYNELFWPFLWEGLFELNENDDPSLLVAVALVQLGDDPAAASFTAHVNCLDYWALHPELDRATRLDDDITAAAAIVAEFPLLAVMDLSFPHPCPFYDQFAPEPLAGPLDGGDVPILVIGNHADPVTPFSESEELVTDTFSNGYLLATSHHKHVVYPENQCVNHHVHRALINGVYPGERRVSCEREDPEPELTAAAGGQINWRIPCVDSLPMLECGRLAVPADYRDPEAGSLGIWVVVHRATTPDQRIAYLLVNPGGPGVSGVTFAVGAAFGQFPDEIVERFDIVGFDPRGVESSEPAFACGNPGEQLALRASVEDDVIDTPEEIAAGEAAANLCIESMGPVGGLLHSAYVARDMDEIRKALGADQISYLGYSYGSALGVWYATLFPESVRAMVVDGADNPVDEAATIEEAIAESIEEGRPTEEILERALQACADPECPIYNDGDPVGYYMEAAAKLDLVNSAAGGYPIVGYLGVISALYAEELWPTLWKGLFELNENDDPAILLELAMRQSAVRNPGASFTEHVNCLDSWALDPEDRATYLEKLATIRAAIEGMFPLTEAASRPYLSICLFYDQFAPPPLEGPFDGGGVPILVVGNHSDPVTSFVESEELATETLSNGYLVETSHPTHTVYPANECVNHHVHRALIDGVYPSEGRVYCEQE